MVLQKLKKEIVLISMVEQCKILEEFEKCLLDLVIWRVGGYKLNCCSFRSKWEVVGQIKNMGQRTYIYYEKFRREDNREVVRRGILLRKGIFKL